MEHPASIQESFLFADFSSLQNKVRETLKEAFEKRKNAEYKLIKDWEHVISEHHLDKFKILEVIREYSPEETIGEYMVKTLRDFYFVFEDEIEQVMKDEDFCIFYKKNGEVYRKAYHLEKIKDDDRQGP